MFDFAAQNLIALGMKKLGKAVAEVTLEDFNSKIFIPLAFLDSISAAELLIRGRILEVEERENIDDLLKIELLHGYSARMAFPRLPEMLRESTGYTLQKTDIYRQTAHLRTLLVTEKVSSKRLIECTLRFAFEAIEPLMIESWSQIILLHLPEYEFDIDQHVETILALYEIDTSYHGSVER
jgi:hypothetical protein